MSFLEDLISSTRARVAEARGKLNEAGLEQRIASQAAVRDFPAAVRASKPALIAEIKRATPSRGDLNVGLDAARQARAYASGGAAAVSVLTEPDFFKGSLDDLQAAAGAGLPLLRKDFILDEFQLLESRAAGADAVLLIVRVVGADLAGLMAATRALGMHALVEVFHESEVELALSADAELIAINHRDLETFDEDRQRTLKLMPLIPEGVVTVAASAVSTRKDVEELTAAGVDAILVGEALVTARDPAAKLLKLRGLA